MKFDILYEIGDDAEDGGELAEIFIRRFLEDMDGLDHEIALVTNDMTDYSVMATIETEARITTEWFNNADWAVKA